MSSLHATIFINQLPSAERWRVAQRLREAGVTGEAFDDCMNSRLYDLEEVIDIEGIISPNVLVGSGFSVDDAMSATYAKLRACGYDVTHCETIDNTHYIIHTTRNAYLYARDAIRGVIFVDTITH